jgi:hypothetical protein
MDYNRIVFSGHAIRQMFRRRLSKKDVIEAIDCGHVIIDYPDDTPYPSCLILGFVKEEPVHVVLAFDQDSQIEIVITAYVPDLHLWTDDFKSRRNKK